MFLCQKFSFELSSKQSKTSWHHKKKNPLNFALSGRNVEQIKSSGIKSQRFDLKYLNLLFYKTRLVFLTSFFFLSFRILMPALHCTIYFTFSLAHISSNKFYRCKVEKNLFDHMKPPVKFSCNLCHFT